MDPITIITTAAIAGSGLIGSELIKRSSQHLWDQFISRLQSKAKGNGQANTALVELNDPKKVREAVIAIGAEQDAELVGMAQQLGSLLQQTAPTQYNQVAEKIINIQINEGTINM